MDREKPIPQENPLRKLLPLLDFVFLDVLSGDFMFRHIMIVL